MTGARRYSHAFYVDFRKGKGIVRVSINLDDFLKFCFHPHLTTGRYDVSGIDIDEQSGKILSHVPFLLLSEGVASVKTV